MKKTISIMLVLLLIASLAGCMYNRKKNDISDKVSDDQKEKATLTRRGTVVSVSDDTITLSIGMSSDSSKQKKSKMEEKEDTSGQEKDGKLPSPPSGKPESAPDIPPEAPDQQFPQPDGQTEPPSIAPSAEGEQPVAPDMQQEKTPETDEKPQVPGQDTSSSENKKSNNDDNPSGKADKDEKVDNADKDSHQPKHIVTVRSSEISVFDRSGKKISPSGLSPGDVIDIGYDDKGNIVTISLTDASSTGKKDHKSQNDENSGSSKKVPKAPSLEDSDSIFDQEETKKSGN